MRRRWDQDASAWQFDAIATEIDRSGYARLQEFISEIELEPLTLFAERALRNDQSYAEFSGTSDFSQTVWADIPRSDGFRALCDGVVERSGFRGIIDDGEYQKFRCLRGRGGAAHSMRFHYDTYLLTVLIPIAIPSKGAPGNLLVMPSTRPVRHTYVSNLVDKALVDNPIAQRTLQARSKKLGATVSIPLTPGDAYLFWGYRSLHTNEGCDSGALRATALLHYGDPHANSSVRAALRKMRGL